MPLQPDGVPTHLGCFHENLYQPDLSGEPPSMIAQAEACFKHCSIGAWSYAAIRNRTICTCGDSFNKYGAGSESECSTSCPEESSVFDHCGGPESNSVYSIGSIVSKVPLPTPSIGGYPTPPILPGGVEDHSWHDDEHHSNKAVVISSSVMVAIVMLGVMLMFIRRRRQIESHAREDPKGLGHGPAPTSGGDRGGESARGGTMGRRRALPRNSSGNTIRAGGTTWLLPEKQTVDKDIEAQLFAGFESCAPDEDPRQPQTHIMISPLDHCPIQVPNSGHHTNPTTITNQPLSSQVYPVSNDNNQARFPSIVSRISERFSQLRVKTQYLQPPPQHHHTHSISSPSSPSTCPSLSLSPSLTTPSSQYPPPISPISPLSPGSLVSLADTLLKITTTTEEVEDDDGDRYDPGNKTPSFSAISQPIPGPASNNNPSRRQKRLSSYSYHSQPWHGMPDNIPTSGPPQSPQAKAQADKEHRSKLIQDLILHGE